MRISVIVPTLNEALSIRSVLETWQFLRQQEHQIVLADGGSSDNTLSQVQTLVDCVIQSERGRAVQMNTGANAAAGDIFWFLHADTRISPELLRQLEVSACRADTPDWWGRFDVQLDDRAWRFRIIATLMNLRSRLTSVSTGDQGLFVHRELFQRCGGFTPLELMEDIDLCKRLRRIARPVNLDGPIVTSARRWKANGYIRTVLLMWSLRLAYFCGVKPDRLTHWYRRDVR